MRENEFEQKVQQKMGAFGLDPSAEVWTEVERRIRKEKKRRFIFWWMALLFLLFGVGITTAILFNNKKGNQTKGIVAKKFKMESQPEHLQNDQASQPSISIIDNNKENVTNLDKNSFEQGIGSNSIIEIVEERKKIAESPYLRNRRHNKALSVKRIKNNSEVVLDQDMSTVSKGRVNQKTPDMIIAKNDSGTIINNEQAVVNEIVSSAISGNEIAESVQENQIQESDTINNTTREKVTNNKLKKWDWGITISAGRSTLSNGFTLFNKSLFADALSYQNSSPGTVTGGSLDNQSLIRPSISWSAGLYIKKSLSKKLDLSLGLGYSYRSTKFTIGNRVDSIRNVSPQSTGSVRVENFYRPSAAGNSFVYTNRYHFINLNTHISWRIIQGKKINLYWENGLSYERLLGSSMLHFTYSLPGYYKDNSQLRKNHLVLSTGLSVPVSQRVIVNPFVSYHLTPVLRNPGFSNVNFNNLGIRMKLLLKNKN